jgi:hypothetical protein
MSERASTSRESRVARLGLQAYLVILNNLLLAHVVLLFTPSHHVRMYPPARVADDSVAGLIVFEPPSMCYVAVRHSAVVAFEEAGDPFRKLVAASMRLGIWVWLAG